MSPKGANANKHGHDDEEHGSGMERWLLTYSDMITLLLVLFIVLYALSSLNHVKYAEFEKGINASFNNGSSQPSSAKTLPNPAKPGHNIVHAEYASAAQIEAQLVKALKAAGVLGDVKVDKTSQGVVEGLVTGKTFYAVDSDALSPLGRRIVDVSASVIKLYRNTDDVDGYTDNEPILPGSPFINNWQLSADRAVYVVTQLQDEGVDPSQLVVAGFGQYYPTVPNDTTSGQAIPANQAQNRRVNIVITNPPNGTGTPTSLGGRG
ncbi:MAG TPA: flagellar motor protein MotB [Acidimicrobiales bacterium]|nr:flagellar motor protein MotB [Acidimicrobiales bacterium]